MYLKYFGLAELPFGLTPDTAFAFGTRAHQEALNTLLLATDGGEGFIQVSGEVGTGKTLLCRTFLATLPAPALTCYLPHPNHTPRTLLWALSQELGLGLPASSNEFTLQRRIHDALLALAAEGRRVVVCVDEAQGLRTANLEALRLLSNLETEKRKLMQLVLFGQPELDRRLAAADLRQLRQRIAFRHALAPMDDDEVARYVAHRLRVAGHRDGELFSRAALAALQRASGGIPRVINILAHKALLAAFGAGADGVERSHVRQAARDTLQRPAPLFAPWRWLFG